MASIKSLYSKLLFRVSQGGQESIGVGKNGAYDRVARSVRISLWSP